ARSLLPESGRARSIPFLPNWPQLKNAWRYTTGDRVRQGSIATPKPRRRARNSGAGAPATTASGEGILPENGLASVRTDADGDHRDARELLHPLHEAPGVRRQILPLPAAIEGLLPARHRLVDPPGPPQARESGVEAATRGVDR